MRKKLEWLLIIYKYRGKKAFVKEIFKLVFNKITNHRFEKNYSYWIRNTEDKWKSSSIEEAKNLQSYDVKFSIIMPTYNVSPYLLQKAIASVQRQTYKNWELCIYDDASTNPDTLEYLKSLIGTDPNIKIELGTKNGHIPYATNQSIRLATGDYLIFMDNDDELSQVCLYENYKAVKEGYEIIYYDEDIISENGRRIFPIFKPGFGIETIHSIMYLSHPCIKKELVDRVGGMREGFQGSQDYDLVLRLVSINQNIKHIPHILYHWRQIEGSTAMGIGQKSYARDSAKKALSESIENRKIEGEILDGMANFTYRVKPKIIGNPRVSIIIPIKDGVELLNQCIESIEDKTSYKNYEIVIVDNNSSEEKTLKYLSKTKHKVLRYNKEFNFSAINNFAASQVESDHILLLNNDTEVINEEWLESLVEYSQLEGIGAVGAMLLFPDNTYQHGGVVLGIGGMAGHAYKGFPIDIGGILERNHIISNVSGVTGACLMIKRKLFLELGGFDENLKVACNDIEFCIRLMNKGFRNVYTPYSKLYHYESKTRGYEDTPEKKVRFQKEREYLINKWPEYIKNDPYYNPNLTRDKEDFDIDFERTVF